MNEFLEQKGVQYDQKKNMPNFWYNHAVGNISIKNNTLWQ